MEFGPQAYLLAKAEIAKPCSAPLISNGNPFPSKRTYSTGERIRIDCNVGYQLNSNLMYSTCQNGRWTPNLPVCRKIAKPCKPPNILDGIPFPLKRTYSSGEQISINCNVGYQLNSNLKSTTCQNGIWNPDLPVCQEKAQPCSSPFIPNGHPSPSKLSYSSGERISIKCNAGYQPNSDLKYIRCQNGIWTPSLPTCKEIAKPCSAPLISNGNPFPSKRTYSTGERIRIDCNVGYQLNSNLMYSTCQNGRWTPNLPVCRKIAKPCKPPNILDGIPFPLKRTYSSGEQISINCNVGYQLNSNLKSTTCQNGIWNPDLPVCQEIAKPCKPPIILDGIPFPLKRTYSSGEQISINCNVGYQLNSNLKSTTCQNGIWNPDLPVCQEIAKPCKPPIILDGIPFPLKRTYSSGEQISINCNVGYQLNSNLKSTTCQNGIWNPDLPVCQEVPKQCSIFFPDDNGRYNPDKTTFTAGEEVFVRCSPGYAPESTLSTCSDDGIWIPNLPTCEKQCTQFAFLNGNYSPSKPLYISGDEISFKCNLGHRLNPQTVQSSVCRAGKWTPNIPFCKSTEAIEGIWTDFGSWSACDVTCGGGISIRERSCQREHFSPTCLGPQTEQRECNADKCPECSAPVLNFGVIVPKRQIYAEEEEIKIECRSGYILIPSISTSVCQPDTSWEPSIPRCERTCSPFISIRNGRHSPKRNVYSSGNKISFTCNVGRKLHPPVPTSICRDGKWFPNIPECRNTETILTKFGPWSICSATCNGGVEIRRRQCRHGQFSPPCSGSETEERECNTQECPECFAPFINDANITPNKQVYAEGEEIKIECRSGYSAVPPVLFSICQNGDKWKPDIPSCEPTLGVWSDFGDWSDCDVTCDDGTQTRERLCKNALSNTMNCPGGSEAAIERRPCNLRPCWNCLAPKFDAGSIMPYKLRYIENDTIQFECKTGYVLVPSISYSICQNIGDWKPSIPKCERQCDRQFSITNGEYTRISENRISFRCNDGYKLNPPANFSTCNAGLWYPDIPTCQEKDSKWTDFGPWSKCDVTCSGGIEIRRRQCRYEPCSGPDTQERECNTRECPECLAPLINDADIKPDRQFYAENDKIEIECRSGNTMIPSIGFSICQNDGNWKPNLPKCEHIEDECKDAQTWCSAVVAGIPDICDSDSELVKTCPKSCKRCKLTTTTTTTEGIWSDFNYWSKCDVSCGGGRQRRTRICQGIPGSCKGESFEERSCNVRKCPEWKDWTKWSECSVTCGDGEQTRSRKCTIARKCEGPNDEYIHCNLETCKTSGGGFLWSNRKKEPRDCKWRAWQGRKCTRRIDGKLRIKQTRRKLDALRGGKACVGPAERELECSEAQHVVSTFMATFGEFGIRKRSRKPNTPLCSTPYRDSKGSIRMIGRKCDSSGRKKRQISEEFQEKYEYEAEVIDEVTEEIDYEYEDDGLRYRDVIFVIDESASIQRKFFEKEVQLASTLITKLCQDITVGKDKTRVALMSFDKENHLHITFDQHFERSSLLDEMSRIQYNETTHGATCLISALDYADTKMFTAAAGSRPPSIGVERLVILITDGCANCGDKSGVTEKLNEIYQQLSDNHISIFSFVIGSNNECIENLSALADGNHCYNTFKLSTWRELDEAIKSIEEHECIEEWSVLPESCE
uniref:complement factor H-like isoform X3 n=1 Tax=Styela clava TaxID=7725 RepID=UPI00193A9D44|nr:complement factor H-like isoform X3 [Styela clava]